MLLKLLKSFLKEEDGMGTVEIILIIAVLVGIALVFRNQLINFVNDIIDRIFPNPENIQDNRNINNAHINT